MLHASFSSRSNVISGSRSCPGSDCCLPPSCLPSMASMRGPLVACVAFAGLVVIAIAQYFFPLLSRYEDPTPVHLRNAAKLALGFFPRTLCMLVILVGFAVLYMQFFVYMIPLLLLMGVTLPQYCCAWIYNWIFRRIDGEIDTGGRTIPQS